MDQHMCLGPDVESRLRTEVLPSGVLRVIVGEDEQQQWSSGVDQEDPEPPHIKEEQEELWSSQEGEQLQGLEEADVTRFSFTPVPVKREDDEEKPHQSPSEQNTETRPPTGADGDHCGGSEDDPLSPTDHRTSHSDPDDRMSESGESDSYVSDDVVLALSSEENTRSDVKESFICSECGKTFYSMSSLNCHKKTHTGEKPFSCSVCTKTFRKRSDLHVHFRIHTGEKPYSCSVCHTSFTKRNALVQHTRTHTGAKPFSCTVCGKTFSQKGHITTHMRTHTGLKPFPCSVCGKMFSEKGHMRRHLEAHSGVKPFSCEVCGKTFSQKGHMSTHMAAHTGEKPFSCSVCDERFTWRSQFKRHKCVVVESDSK